MKAVADTLRVSRSNLHDKVRRASKRRGSYRKPDDDEVLPLVRRLVDERPNLRRLSVDQRTQLARENAGAGELKATQRDGSLHGSPAPVGAEGQ